MVTGYSNGYNDGMRSAGIESQDTINYYLLRDFKKNSRI